MAITANDYDELRSSGFIDYEITDLANATKNQYTGESQGFINLNTPVWQKVLRSRENLMNQRLDYYMDQGYSPDEARRLYENDIANYYRRSSKRSPWDFLKAEYQSPARIDYIKAARARALKRLGRGRLNR
jgi:hypothetical protein